MDTLPDGTPVFSFSQLADFRARILALGGSSDVSSGAQVASDVDITGRYARNYSRDLPDVPGRTISFYCSPRRPGEWDRPGYTPVVVLTGCPWGTAEERDATYAALASCGCLPNDARQQDPTLVALDAEARGGGLAMEIKYDLVGGGTFVVRAHPSGDPSSHRIETSLSGEIPEALRERLQMLPRNVVRIYTIDALDDLVRTRLFDAETTTPRVPRGYRPPTQDDLHWQSRDGFDPSRWTKE